MSPRSAALLASALGCSALLDFDPATLPLRDGGARDAPAVDAPAVDAAVAPDRPLACATPCGGGLVCISGACACPAGTRDCGEGRGGRCRECCDGAHCDDNDGCTTDRCDPDGRCEHRGCEGARVCCDRARCCVGSCAGRCQ